MTTFRLPAPRLSTLAAAALLLSVPAIPATASAAEITYRFTSLVSGEEDVLSDPTATPQAFDDVRIDLVLHGDLPGIDRPHTDLVDLDGGRIVFDGQSDHLTFGPDAVFAIHPADGVAGFGQVDAGAFTPVLGFRSPALDGYDGTGGLGRTDVAAAFKTPITFQAGGQTIQLTIDDVDRARFSASVPEPAAWAMMLTGFAGAGALLRRRRAADA